MADASGSVPAPASGSSPPSPKSGGSSQSGPDPLIGRVVNDRFRIVALLARGGMGKVYRAEQAPLGREVALKVLNPNYSGDSDPEFHKRFFLEASTCSKLTHPNTVTIFDYGRTDDDVYYIAMELLEGKTLHRALRESGPFDAGRALQIARQICRSLREAHSLGVIHRDLKPANVYLVRHGDEQDFAKVLDFGLVKNLEDKGEDLTQTGLFMGSPKYMSPEQIRGERVDARADIYALGVMMYEMITGKVPFDRPNSVNILMAHVHEPPPPIRETNPEVQISPLLEQIIMKTMAKSADDRFASMDELLVALKHVTVEAGLALSGSHEMGMSGEFQVGPAATGSHPAVNITGDPLGSTGSGPGAFLAGGALRTPGAINVPPSSGVSVAPEEPKNRTPLYAAGAIAAVLALAGLAFTLSGGDPQPVETTVPPVATGPSTAPTTGPSTSTTPPTPVEPPITRTLVSLRSEPPGAMVRVGDQQYGPTPADVEWTGEEAVRGREVTFLFELSGHRDFTVTRTITADSLEVSAALDEIRAATPGRGWRPRPPRRDESGGGGPVGPVKGYKLDPY